MPLIRWVMSASSEEEKAIEIRLIEDMQPEPIFRKLQDCGLRNFHQSGSSAIRGIASAQSLLIIKNIEGISSIVEIPEQNTF